MSDWISDAECRGLDVSHFFPENGKIRDDVRAACARCRVKTECLAEAFAVPGDLDLGFRAGMTPRQRRDLRARRVFPTYRDTSTTSKHEPIPIVWDAARGKYVTQ